MASIIKRSLGLLRGGEDRKEVLVEDDQVSDKPYVISSLFYIMVVMFIGLPMWFYTCSKTRYSLPNLTELENKLTVTAPKLNLEISVVQLSRFDAFKSDDDYADEQTNYLRINLPNELETSITNVTYDINWRVRRPTKDEFRIFQLYAQEKNFTGLASLEQSLIKIHKPSSKFKLFMFLIEEKNYSAFCDPARPHTYTIGFERFIYLCPSYAMTKPNDYSPILNLIKDALNELYSNTIDPTKSKHILVNHIDLLFSLIPESLDELEKLAPLADKVHHIFDKNIREQFPELKELINILPITQYVIDLLDQDLMNRIVKKSTLEVEVVENKTVAFDGPRLVQIDKISQLFHSFESRINKHSSQNVHNTLLISPDSTQPPLSFKKQEIDEVTPILEGQEMSSLLVANNEKSLVLGIRALVRRVAGLTSVNICKNCHVRRDVFFNRCELDAIMGFLIIAKLQSTLISLRSISQQIIGIKIPKDVSTRATEAHSLAKQAIEHLETKQNLDAYRLASKAFELSESAYYDPSLLESLYFPDDLKYAIYLPLFLPLALPFLTSIVRLVKRLFKSPRKETKLKVN